MNYQVSIQSDKYSRDHLMKQIDYIIDLMDKEHHHCSTHSQRNAYQAVIRHELEIIRDELLYARVPGDDNSAVPF